MVNYSASVISTRRLFVLALMISLFVHLVGVFLIKVRFIDVKVPGSQWISIGIKDDLWFESGIELPSAAPSQDQQEMRAMFQYQYSSEQLDLLSPEKPVMTQLQPEIDEMPVRMPLQELITKKITYPASSLQKNDSAFAQDKASLTDDSRAPFLDSKKQVSLNENVQGLSPVLKIAQKMKEGKDRVLKTVMRFHQPVSEKNGFNNPMQSYILEGQVKDREIIFMKLPDCIVQPIQEGQISQYAIKTVRIEFWVRSDGNVGFTRILQSSDDQLLDAHSVISLESWKFIALHQEDGHNDLQRGIITFRIQELKDRLIYSEHGSKG
ncbi:MAG: energy transducer TonB [Chlamydiota bacterium]|nr:energy transducer TonB [Chlamydiota bacterium]